MLNLLLNWLVLWPPVCRLLSCLTLFYLATKARHTHSHNKMISCDVSVTYLSKYRFISNVASTQEMFLYLYYININFLKHLLNC